MVKIKKVAILQKKTNMKSKGIIYFEDHCEFYFLSY